MTYEDEPDEDQTFMDRVDEWHDRPEWDDYSGVAQDAFWALLDEAADIVALEDAGLTSRSTEGLVARVVLAQGAQLRLALGEPKDTP